MARFYGKVGYSMGQVETLPGVYTNSFEEHRMFGDVVERSIFRISGDTINDNLELGNLISVVGDKYSFSNFSNIVYVIIDGIKWKVTKVDVKPPRLILSLGGVFNE